MPMGNYKFITYSKTKKNWVLCLVCLSVQFFFLCVAGEWDPCLHLANDRKGFYHTALPWASFCCVHWKGTSVAIVTDKSASGFSQRMPALMPWAGCGQVWAVVSSSLCPPHLGKVLPCSFLASGCSDLLATQQLLRMAVRSEDQL